MKPFLEKVASEEGSSLGLLDRKLSEGIPFEWHHHPEYELTLTLNSTGHRYIGDNITTYTDGDLVLVGPDLPHSWHSSERVDVTSPHVAKVVWFSEAWIDALTHNFPELYRLRSMADKSRRGISFSNEVAAKVRPALERLFEMAPDERFLTMVGILRVLSLDKDFDVLSHLGSIEDTNLSEPRLAKVFDFLNANYMEKVEIPHLADLANLSVSAFHRVFRRNTRLSPIAYVGRLRIGRACALLIEGKLKINAIASTVGYESLAQFNKQFRKDKGMTPREFARQFRN